jgi:ABC-2 type transport system permease protein
VPAVNDDVRPEQVVFLPQDDIQSVVQTKSVDVVGTALYNYTDGYGTYLIPAVLMVVIFQTLIFVISMLSGKERETGDILMFAGPKGRDLSFLRMASVVIGKSFTYLAFYAFCWGFFL